MVEWMRLRPDIDHRTFRYRLPPENAGGLESALYGTPQQQWRWWYSEQRRKHSAHLRAKLGPPTGEIGVVENVRFVVCERPWGLMQTPTPTIDPGAA